MYRGCTGLRALAFLIEIPGIIKAVLVDSLGAVDNSSIGSNIVYESIVLALETEYIHSGSYIVIELAVYIDIIIDGLEHSADDTLGKGAFISLEEVNAFAAENISGKITVTVFPGSRIPLDGSAVLILEHLKRNRNGLTGSIRVQIPVTEPLYFLVFKLYVTKLFSSGVHGLSLLGRHSLGVDGNCRSRSGSGLSRLFSGCGSISAASFATAAAASAAGSKTQRQRKSREPCDSSFDGCGFH